MELLVYLNYDFVQKALIVGTLVALCCGLLGVVLVLKRLSLIGESLSHVSFTLASIALICSITNEIIITFPVTFICVLLLLSDNKKLSGDSSVALISVGSLSMGYLLINMFASNSNVSGDVCSTLFGATSILTLSTSDVIISVVLTLCLLVIFFILYNKIFAVTFDSIFSSVSGIKVKFYNILIALLVSLVVTLGMNLVGALLVSGLIIFPVLSLMRVCSTFKGVIRGSAFYSVVTSLGGMLISILLGTPVGSTIIAMDLVCFCIFTILGRVLGRS